MTTNGNGQLDRSEEIMQLLVGFMDETTQFMKKTTQFMDETTQFMDETKQFMDETKQFMGETTQFMDETKQFMGETTQFMDETKQFMDEQKQFNAKVTEDISRLNNDVGQLKGFHVRAVALQRTGIIARNLELTEFHVLSQEEVGSLANRLGRLPNFDVEEGDRLSFAAADLIIEAHGEGRTKHYIAAEISYTVNRDDVHRAVRNTGYLRLLTDNACHAVVIGCEKTADVDNAISNDAISWHHISNRAMAPA